MFTGSFNKTVLRKNSTNPTIKIYTTGKLAIHGASAPFTTSGYFHEVDDVYTCLISLLRSQ